MARSAPASFPNRVRQVRKAKGLTIKDLHERSGVAIGHISDVENGKKSPRIDTALRLASGLGTTVDDLFGSDDIRYSEPCQQNG